MNINLIARHTAFFTSIRQFSESELNWEYLLFGIDH